MAAARIIAGPPMSMFSTHRGIVGAGNATCLERVEIDDDEIDRLDAVVVHGRGVLGIVADAEQAAVDRGCSVLTRPSIISGKPVSSATSLTGSAGFGDRLGGAAGRDQLDAGRAEGRGEIDEAGLVGNRDQRPADPDQIGRGNVFRRDGHDDVLPHWVSLPLAQAGAGKEPCRNGSGASKSPPSRGPLFADPALALRRPLEGAEPFQPPADLWRG